jgi:hypothetical protein
MATNDFLKRLEPSLKRGSLRIQPYVDHSRGDGYA